MAKLRGMNLTGPVVFFKREVLFQKNCGVIIHLPLFFVSDAALYNCFFLAARNFHFSCFHCSFHLILLFVILVFLAS